MDRIRGKLVDANAGYDFRWSPDGTRIAYSILTPFGVEEYEGEQYPYRVLCPSYGLRTLTAATDGRLLSLELPE